MNFNVSPVYTVVWFSSKIQALEISGFVHMSKKALNFPKKPNKGGGRCKEAQYFIKKEAFNKIGTRRGMSVKDHTGVRKLNDKISK